MFPQGCTAFKPISSNLEREESGIKDDSGMQDVQYTEVSPRGLGRGEGKGLFFPKVVQHSSLSPQT